MEFDDLHDSGFDDVTLLHSIIELTHEVENLDEFTASPLQHLNPDDFLNSWDGLSVVSTPQKRSAEEPPTSTLPESCDKDTETTVLAEQTLTPTDFQLEDGPAVATENTGTIVRKPQVGSTRRGRPRNASKRKRSAQEAPAEVPPIVPDESVRRYNLRRRSRPIYYGDGSVSQDETPRRRRPDCEQSTEKPSEESGRRRAAKLKTPVSKLVEGIDCEKEDGSNDISTGAKKRRLTEPAVIRRHDAQVHGTQLVVEDCPITSCQESDPTDCPEAEPRSTSADICEWDDESWYKFFDIFSAVAAEVRTIRNMKFKKDKARRRWLSCVRYVVNGPPF